MKRLSTMLIILLASSGGCLRLCFEHEFPQVHLGPIYSAGEGEE